MIVGLPQSIGIDEDEGQVPFRAVGALDLVAQEDFPRPLLQAPVSSSSWERSISPRRNSRSLAAASRSRAALSRSAAAFIRAVAARPRAEVRGRRPARARMHSGRNGGRFHRAARRRPHRPRSEVRRDRNRSRGGGVHRGLAALERALRGSAKTVDGRASREFRTSIGLSPRWPGATIQGSARSSRCRPQKEPDPKEPTGVHALVVGL